VTNLSLAHQLITKDKWTHFLRNRCINRSITEQLRTATFIRLVTEWRFVNTQAGTSSMLLE